MAPPLPCSPPSLSFSLAARPRVHPSLVFLQTKSACFQASTSYRIASLKLHTSRKITTLEVRRSGPHVCNKKTVQMMAMLGNGYVPRVVSLHLSFSSLRIALLRVVTAEKEHDHPSLFTKVDDQLVTKQVESKGSSEESERGMMCQEEWNVLGGRVLASIATILLAACLWVTPVHAADALKTCACLLKECRVELARCIADPACAANVACLQTCNDRPDETECQIGCGDLFENSVVDQFNECAVSKKKCVPQKPDDGYFPVPSSTAIVKKFNTSDFDGKWYISSGLNPTFDTFDCQLHEFSSSSNKLTGKISWRIRTPDGGFFTRSTVQNFVQDPNQPGVLYNHDNEFLHYQDDWYILSAKTENKLDDYIFVYYRGRNDAWDGYGGAVVYTRSKTLPPSIVPELKEAAKRAGIDFKKFRATDNTCGPEPPLFARLEKKVEEGEQALVEEVQEIEKKVEEVGKTEMTLLQKLGKGLQELKRDQEYFLKELGDEEKAVLKDLQMEAEQVEKLFGKALPIRKLR